MSVTGRGVLLCFVVVLGLGAPSLAKSSWQEEVRMLRQQMDQQTKRLSEQAEEIQQLRKQLHQPRVAYVSGKVLEQTLEGSFRMRELTQKKERLEQKLKKREAQLKAQEAGLLKVREGLQQKAGMGMMDPKALQQEQMEFQQKAGEFQKEFAELQKMQYTSQEQIRKMQQEFSVILKAKMEPVKQKVEKELGLPIVYEEVLFAVGSAVDVTSRLVHAYNEKYPWPPPEAKQSVIKEGKKGKKSVKKGKKH
ncbi:MAG: OmpH family outer membrane protein [Myxococcota bacterium]